MQKDTRRDEESCLDGMLLEVNLEAGAGEDLRKEYSEKKDQFSGMPLNVKKKKMSKEGMYCMEH